MSSTSAYAATQAYEDIKRRIIGCDYPQGTKLSEARLVEELGVGRSPIRSALARLRSEGWVEVSPQSGSYVKRLTRQEMRDIFDFRILLETHAVRMAARQITPEALRQLKVGLMTLTHLANKAPSPLNAKEFSAFDSLVHATIYQAGGNSLVADALRTLQEKALWMQKSTPSNPKRMTDLLKELRLIVEALEAGDPELAAQRVQEHISNVAAFEMAYAAP